MVINIASKLPMGLGMTSKTVIKVLYKIKPKNLVYYLDDIYDLDSQTMVSLATPQAYANIVTI